jgi:hypothetical protein
MKEGLILTRPNKEFSHIYNLVKCTKQCCVLMAITSFVHLEARGSGGEEGNGVWCSGDMDE